ncbi:hypothetical protein C8R45DRAFT_1112264 [Mycena sanguinolenta]|nr:hypothetical protein C8R45DRAFT_1112264 [Mycena sanguinolenta]
MLFKVVFSALALVSAVAAAPPPVFTATRVYQTVTDVAPYIVTATTTVVWTASPTTTFAHPTGPGLPGSNTHQ